MAAQQSTSRLQPRITADAIALLIAGLALVLLASAELLTAAFTDYELEAQPAITALLDGHLSTGLELLPLYGGAVLIELPFAAAAQSLGAGIDGVYRALALPGALGLLALVAVALRWARERDATTRLGWLAAFLIVTAPSLAQSWNFGHAEEALVTSLAVGGLILAVGTETKRSVLGAVLLGLAAAGKPWAVVVLAVAVLTAPSVRHAIRTALVAGIAGAVLIGPMLAAQASNLTAGLAATGGASIFSVGNAWWFFGTSNPDFVQRAAGEPANVSYFSLANSARLGPDFIGAHAHELIVMLAVVLAGTWAWLAARKQRSAAPAAHATPSASGADQPRGKSPDANASVAAPRDWDRLTSILLLAAAVLWWRAALDPWFQSYYLLPAFLCLVLADTRRGALPVAALITWCAMWTLHGQSSLSQTMDPDLRSALTIAITVPVGVWITARALRSAR